MRPDIIINHFVRTDKTKQDAIFPVNRIRPIAGQFSFKLVGAQTTVKAVGAKPFIFLGREILNVSRKFAKGFLEGRGDVDNGNRGRHKLTAKIG